MTFWSRLSEFVTTAVHVWQLLKTREKPLVLPPPRVSVIEKLWVVPSNVGPLKRGEANKNPGNIDYSAHIPYRGMIGPEQINGAPGRFAVFGSHEDGIHAMAECLLAYYRNHGIRTIDSDVERWAPGKGPDKNPTVAYKTTMALVSGFGVTEWLNFQDADVLTLLIAGHIRMEEGRIIYPAEIIQLQVARALGSINIAAQATPKVSTVTRIMEYANLKANIA